MNWTILGLIGFIVVAIWLIFVVLKLKIGAKAN